MLRFLTAAYVSNAAAVTALQAVLVVAAAQRFGHDTAVGWLYAAVGAGSLLGTLPVIRKTPRRVNTLPIVVATAIELGAACALRVRAASFPVAVGAALRERPWRRALPDPRLDRPAAARTPEELLGRTMAVIRSAQYLGMLVGALAAVRSCEPLGWQATVLIVCTLGATLLFFTAVTEGRGSRG